jgi:Holin of 3TMs, for gene-transfer release
VFALLLPVLAPILERLATLIPDPEARAKAAAEAESQLMAALQASDAAQMETNRQEAANASLFVAGWRPGAGWVCVIALGYQYLAVPLVSWGFAARGLDLPALPTLDNNLWELLTGMLGLGTLRTIEKARGVATDALGSTPRGR